MFAKLKNQGAQHHVVLVQQPRRANLTRVTSPPNSNTDGSRLIFSIPFSYFLFVFYLPRCTIPDFPSVSSLAFLPFLPCCHYNNNSSNRRRVIFSPNSICIGWTSSITIHSYIYITIHSHIWIWSRVRIWPRVNSINISGAFLPRAWSPFDVLPA